MISPEAELALAVDIDSINGDAVAVEELVVLVTQDIETGRRLGMPPAFLSAMEDVRAGMIELAGILRDSHQ